MGKVKAKPKAKVEAKAKAKAEAAAKVEEIAKHLKDEEKHHGATDEIQTEIEEMEAEVRRLRAKGLDAEADKLHGMIEKLEEANAKEPNAKESKAKDAEAVAIAQANLNRAKAE